MEDPAMEYTVYNIIGKHGIPSEQPLPHPELPTNSAMLSIDTTVFSEHSHLAYIL
jgi:hypothetical protein